MNVATIAAIRIGTRNGRQVFAFAAETIQFPENKRCLAGKARCLSWTAIVLPCHSRFPALFSPTLVMRSSGWHAADRFNNTKILNPFC